jgi:hypothetical protein
MRFVAGGITALLGAVALTSGTATAAPIENRNFERGSLAGWSKSAYPSPECGRWRARPATISRGDGFPPPPQGEFAAVADQPDCPSGQILSQVVKLREGRTHRLAFELAYLNINVGDPDNFITPATLGLGMPNQQFRMDVLKPGAPPRSVENRHVLKRVYRTEEDDPNQRSYRTVRANLTPFAGERVRLRFAVVVNQAPLVVGIDSVAIRSRRR